MATIIIFILGVIMLNIAFSLQLRDYSALGKNAKMFTVTVSGLKSNMFYSFAIGFLAMVVSGLYDDGVIPIYWGDGHIQKLTSIVLIPVFIVLFTALYGYHIHKMRMAETR